VVWSVGPASSLLLMQRSDNACWGLPGGYVECGESVSEAVVREVREETGVQIALGRLVGVYSDPAVQVIAYPGGDRVQAVNLCFEARPIAAGEPTTPAETLATGYFAPDALPEPLVPIHQIRIRDARDGDPFVRIR
jgi:ADP-ribose pyrophosphatase YjhB (NUDIX family)